MTQPKDCALHENAVADSDITLGSKEMPCREEVER